MWLCSVSASDRCGERHWSSDSGGTKAQSTSPDSTGSPHPANSDRKPLCLLRGSNSISSFAVSPNVAEIQKR